MSNEAHAHDGMLVTARGIVVPADLLREARSGLAAYTGSEDGACSETIARIDAVLARPAVSFDPGDVLRYAAQELLDACVKDMGYGDEAGASPDAHDEPVGSSSEGPCAVQFGHLRRLREALAAAPQPSEATAAIDDLRVQQGHAGLWYATSSNTPGLLVAAPTEAEARAAVPQALADLREATASTQSVAPDQTPPRGGVTVEEIAELRLAMPDGDVLKVEYPSEKKWATSWAIITPSGNTVTGERDWEIVENYGLTPIIEAILDTLSRQSPGTEPSVPTQPVGGVSVSVEEIAYSTIAEENGLPLDLVKLWVSEDLDCFDTGSWGRVFQAKVSEVRAILARIAAPAVATEQGWEPIETAPKDGTHILIADTIGAVSEARWVADDNGWWAANNDPTDHWGEALDAIYWQPMPAPPASPTPVDREA